MKGSLRKSLCEGNCFKTKQILRTYPIFNKTTILCYTYLDIPDMPKYNYQYAGKKYTEVCAIAK